MSRVRIRRRRANKIRRERRMKGERASASRACSEFPHEHGARFAYAPVWNDADRAKENVSDLVACKDEVASASDLIFPCPPPPQTLFRDSRYTRAAPNKGLSLPPGRRVSLSQYLSPSLYTYIRSCGVQVHLRTAMHRRCIALAPPKREGEIGRGRGGAAVVVTDDRGAMRARGWKRGGRRARGERICFRVPVALMTAILLPFRPPPPHRGSHHLALALSPSNENRAPPPGDAPCSSLPLLSFSPLYTDVYTPG